VYSWRLGISLGVDPLSQDAKTCNFSCSYCQLGRTESLCQRRKVFVKSSDIIAEIKAMPPRKLDYITFAGKGEPTLAKNLGDLIRSVKRIHKHKIAVITNGALLGRKDVRDDLRAADFVLVKLDAPCQKNFIKINHPGRVQLTQIIRGIKAFRRVYKGKLGLQIMFVSINKGQAQALASLAGDMGADEIQVNTPLRKSPIRPLPPKEMHEIKAAFKGFRVKMVYDYEHKDIKPIDHDSMVQRHGVSG